jgi:ribosomal protein S18 acetylase RimI-like enzyme
MMLVPTRVGPSPIEGFGLFAAADIEKGAPVWAFTPGVDVELSKERFERERGIAAEFLDRYAYFDAQRGAFVLCVDDARFMNHSEQPNVSPTEDDRCVALRDVAAGEELTCDYRHLDPRPREWVLLRQAAPGDQAAIAALFAEHLEALGYAPDPELDRDMRAPWESYAGGAFLLAQDGDQVVGMGGLLDRELRRIYVSRSHRRRGIADKLLASLLADPGLARPAVRAIVARDNDAARALFLSHGFSSTGRRPADPKAAHCEILERCW